MFDAEQHIQRVLTKSASSRDLLRNLQGFRKWLLPDTPNLSLDDDDIQDDQLERQFLDTSSEDGDSNPFPDHVVEDIFAKQEVLNKFMADMFSLRYGWKEEKAPRSKSQKNTLVKPQLISTLDEFIKWFQYQPLGEGLLCGYIHSIEKASQTPLVRKQTLHIGIDWIKTHVTDVILDVHFLLIKSLMLLGLRDVWSAIRSMVVSRLSPIIECFSLSQLQHIFTDLIKICNSESSSWQAKEGAIMAINCVIRRFQWVGMEMRGVESISENKEFPSPKTKYFLKFGPEELAGLPSFIISQMRSTIFPLLAHPQLTVRENMTKAFSSYLARCEFKEALSAFKDIIDQLCRGIDMSQTMPHEAVMDPSFQFMDAYEAEGLLGVCVCLVKHIPPGFLLPNWPVYFSTFRLYLTHPASTVRQSASDIFKFLVAKDSHNPMIFKLVLQGLIRDWNMTPAQLAMPCNRAVNPALLLAAVDHTSPSSHSNHLSTLGPQTKSTRPSILNMASAEKKSLISESWEWREGHLFAYEVIFQFLIKNHIIYTFGSLQHTSNTQDTTEKLPAPGSSVDEVMFSRNRGHSVSTQSGARSFGGSSLKMALSKTLSDKASESVNKKEEHRNFNSPVKNGVGHSVVCNGRDDTMGATLCDDESGMRKYATTVGRHQRVRNSICTTSPAHELPPFHYSDRSSLAVGAADSATARLYANKRRSLQRLPTVAGFASPSLKTLVKHYSYFNQGSTPFQAPRSHYYGKAASLLMHTLALDVQQMKNTEKSPRNRHPSGDADLEKESLRSCLVPSPLGSTEVPEWIETLELAHMAELLKTVLYQTIESLADPQWELRRMGQQLLPVVVEVTRWYDMKILEDLWQEHLQPTTSLLCYGACLSLKYSVDHAAKLLPMLNSPPQAWQDTELCRQVVLRVTESLRSHLPQWTQVVHSLVRRPCYDKLTIAAIHLLILAHTHFKLPAEQKSLQVASIVGVIREVFITAHPDAALVSSLQEPTVTPSSKEFLTPLQGFLTCIPLKANGVQSCARQVEKALLGELHVCLPQYLQHSSITDMVTLLPMLAFYAGHYADMDTFHKGIIDSLNHLSTCCRTYLKSHSAGDEVYTMCVAALLELAHVVTNKLLEVTVLRQVLDLYISLCQQVAAQDHLRITLVAVYSRLTNVSSARSAVPAYVNHLGHSVDTDLTPPSPVPNLPQHESQSSETDDELDMPGKGLAESQMLNISSLSTGSRTSRHSVSADGRPASSLSEGSDHKSESDWDSWDEDEEEDQEILRVLLVEFVQKLQAHYSPSGDFHRIMRQLSVRERKVIESLL